MLEAIGFGDLIRLNLWGEYNDGTKQSGKNFDKAKPQILQEVDECLQPLHKSLWIPSGSGFSALWVIEALTVEETDPGSHNWKELKLNRWKYY